MATDNNSATFTSPPNRSTCATPYTLDVGRQRYRPRFHLLTKPNTHNASVTRLLMAGTLNVCLNTITPPGNNPMLYLTHHYHNQALCSTLCNQRSRDSRQKVCRPRRLLPSRKPPSNTVEAVVPPKGQQPRCQRNCLCQEMASMSAW